MARRRAELSSNCQIDIEWPQAASQLPQIILPLTASDLTGNKAGNASLLIPHETPTRASSRAKRR
jgi:hypothetical protein